MSKKKEMSEMTQEELVLDFLRKNKGGITSKIAFEQLGIAQLPNIILKLRRRGVRIEDDTANSNNRFGKMVHFKVYYLGRD